MRLGRTVETATSDTPDTCGYCASAGSCDEHHFNTLASCSCMQGRCEVQNVQSRCSCETKLRTQSLSQLQQKRAVHSCKTTPYRWQYLRMPIAGLEGVNLVRECVYTLEHGTNQKCRVTERVWGWADEALHNSPGQRTCTYRTWALAWAAGRYPLLISI